MGRSRHDVRPVRPSQAGVLLWAIPATLLLGCSAPGSSSGPTGSPALSATVDGSVTRPSAPGAEGDEALVLVIDALAAVARNEPVRVERRAADGGRTVSEYVPPEAKRVVVPDQEAETIVLGDRSWTRQGQGPWQVVSPLDPGPDELELDPVTARQVAAAEQVTSVLPPPAAGERRFVVTFDDRSTGVLDVDGAGRPARLERRLADDPARPEVSTYVYDPAITIGPPATG